MREIFGRVLLMLLLMAGAAVLWSMGQAERRLAEGHKQLATLHYAGPAEDYADIDHDLRFVGRIPSQGQALRADAREQQAAADYWLGRYGEITPERDSAGALTEHDPQVLFLAANAAYHASQAKGADRQQTIQALEDVMKNYVDVLKTSPGHTDAAYNYEFVIRKRNQLANPPKPGALPKPDAAATIHGRPGAPPKDSDMTQFKVVIPKREEEREDPDAGDRMKRIRRG